jgi:hypothetical protein
MARAALATNGGGGWRDRGGTMARAALATDGGGGR